MILRQLSYAPSRLRPPRLASGSGPRTFTLDPGPGRPGPGAAPMDREPPRKRRRADLPGRNRCSSGETRVESGPESDSRTGPRGWDSRPNPGPSARFCSTQPAVTELRRRWESCGPASRPPGGDFDFSVLCYNILSQQLLQDHAALYRHCPAHFLSWSHRLPSLLAEIQQLDADVLCLQEVQEDHYLDQIRPALQARGFQCEFKKRTGSKPDGCCVAFRTSRLSLVSAHPVEFCRASDPLLDRDNVGLVLLLRPSAPGWEAAPLCVANTHLLFNPRRGDVKLAQLAVLLAEIRHRARRADGSPCPVLLCGDLNATPWSPLYRFLTTGRLRYQGLRAAAVSGQEGGSQGQRLLQSPIWSHSLGISRQCRYQEPPPPPLSSVEDGVSGLSVQDPGSPDDSWTIEHGLRLQSSYLHRLPPDGRPEVTTFHARTAMTVDYILYSPEPSSGPSGRGLQLLGRLSLVGGSELEAVHGLPNRRHSSDHLPLLARFRLARPRPVGRSSDGSSTP